MKKLLFTIFIFCSVALFAQEEGTPVYHEVVPGNTLYGIATANKVPVEVVRQWNKMTGYSIKVGQKLIVGYIKPDAEKTGTEKPESSPPAAAVKPTTSETKSETAEPAKPATTNAASKTTDEKPAQKTESAELKPEPKNETIEDLGFNVTEVDTNSKPLDLSAFFHRPMIRS
jgi:murein DD-endopeptidase MepM/ murein hydrolase activator NlpD